MSLSSYLNLAIRSRCCKRDTTIMLNTKDPIPPVYVSCNLLWLRKTFKTTVSGFRGGYSLTNSRIIFPVRNPESLFTHISTDMPDSL